VYTRHACLQEAIAAGTYDVVNENITAEKFNIEGAIVVAADILLYRPCDETLDDIVAQLAWLGLRPATLPELLALGELHPQLQHEHAIGAVGGIRNVADHFGAFPYLDASWHERRLDLEVWHGPWDEQWRFAAVHTHWFTCTVSL
jgi:hypothetical protein